MNFGFAFNANSRAKLHDLAERHRGHSNVPGSAVDFIRESIDVFPDGTMVRVEAQGHKAQLTPELEHLAAATVTITVMPIVPTR